MLDTPADSCTVKKWQVNEFLCQKIAWQSQIKFPTLFADRIGVSFRYRDKHRNNLGRNRLLPTRRPPRSNRCQVIWYFEPKPPTTIAKNKHFRTFQNLEIHSSHFTHYATFGRKKIQFNFFLAAAAVAQSVKRPGLRSLTRGATELTWFWFPVAS